MITRFFLYFASRHSALQAVTVLNARGFDASTSLGWDDPFWNTIAWRKVDAAQVHQVDEQMRALATSLGGDYGGYEQRPPPRLPPS